MVGGHLTIYSDILPYSCMMKAVFNRMALRTIPIFKLEIFPMVEKPTYEELEQGLRSYSG